MAKASEQVYRDLVRGHAARMWRLAYRLTGDRDDADDLVQQAYFEAWRSIESLRDPAAGRSWLTTILLRRAARRLRSAATRPYLELTLDEGDVAAADKGPDLDLLARQEDIQRALDALDPERRTVFLLVFLEGLSCREVAERMDLPLGTVLSRIHRARGELRRRLRHLAVLSRGGREAGAGSA